MSTQPRAASRIPTFGSLEEEAAFWDTHDLGDFEDEMEQVTVEGDGPIGHVLSVRLDSVAFRRLSAIAKQRGLTTTTLAQTWVLEALDRADPPGAATVGRRASAR